MSLKVIIVDYGMGNLRSVKKMLDRLGVDSVVSSKPSDLANCDKVILPGVGHFGKAMSNLRELELIEPLNEAVVVRQKPVLGICLGMQLMALNSEEGGVKGLEWFDAEIVKLCVSDGIKFKVPHLGWNRLIRTKESPLMSGIGEAAEFYFVHSFHFSANNRSDVLNETEYEQPFVSAISKDNMFGVQFHPEKSQDDGMRLMRNFINL